MTVRKTVKVPGGKLLRLSVDIEKGVLVSVSLRGDFFAHPEEGFDRAEAGMSGTPADRFGLTLREALAREGVQLFGLSADDAVAAFQEVYRDIPTT